MSGSPAERGTVASVESPERAGPHLVPGSGFDRWRIRAADPLASQSVCEVSDTMARGYEDIFMTAPGEGAESSES